MKFVPLDSFLKEEYPNIIWQIYHESGDIEAAYKAFAQKAIYKGRFITDDKETPLEEQLRNIAHAECKVAAFQKLSNMFDELK